MCFFNEELFVVAEMSGNHNQSLERALMIIDAAVKAGVSAVKLQTYTADTLTINIADREFLVDDSASLWNGENLYSLYSQAYTPWEWHKEIFSYCKKKGILCFSSPFDDTSVDFLESLNCPIYKIASPEIVDLPLIKKIAQTGKPIIMSTGMADIKEIADAVEVARQNGCVDLTLLKCNSCYPANPQELNLMTIPHMKQLFDCPVGLSDHTLGIGSSIAAVALGATVIEKHFTLKRSDGGVDSAFSMEPKEMTELVTECKNAKAALGRVRYGSSKQENDNKIYRRSLYSVKEIKKGEILNSSNIRSIRPGLGLEPKWYDVIIGKRASVDIKYGTALSWNMIE